MIQTTPSIRYGVTHRADTSRQDRAAHDPFHHPCLRGAKQLEVGTLEEEVALSGTDIYSRSDERTPSRARYRHTNAQL